MISEEYTRLLMQTAEEVGRQFSVEYPFLDAEDIAQEVALKALEEWRMVESRLKDAAKYGRTEREVLRFLLSQRAVKYCRKEGYAYMLRSARTVYTPKEVRTLLRIYYNPDTWQVPDKDADFGVVVEGQSVWANLADLKTALANVPSRVYTTILAAFGPEDLELPPPDRRRVADAVAIVTRELNKHLNQRTDGPGSRRVQTNHEAIKETR